MCVESGVRSCIGCLAVQWSGPDGKECPRASCRRFVVVRVHFEDLNSTSDGALAVTNQDLRAVFGCSSARSAPRASARWRRRSRPPGTGPDDSPAIAHVLKPVPPTVGPGRHNQPTPGSTDSAKRRSLPSEFRQRHQRRGGRQGDAPGGLLPGDGEDVRRRFDDPSADERPRHARMRARVPVMTRRSGRGRGQGRSRGLSMRAPGREPVLLPAHGRLTSRR